MNSQIQEPAFNLKNQMPKTLAFAINEYKMGFFFSLVVSTQSLLSKRFSNQNT